MTTVLLIDPDLQGIAPVRNALEAQGLDVVGAGDSHSGLEQARTLLPQCILLCVELTGASGYALCNKLRRDPELSRLPLVLASSQATAATFEEHSRLRTHADAYLHKPYDISTVLRALAKFVPIKSIELSGDSAGQGQKETGLEGAPAMSAAHGPARLVASDAGSVQTGIAVGDPSPNEEVSGATLPLMTNVVPDAEIPGVGLNADAQALLEEAVDTQSSTQVLKISPEGKLQPQGRHSAVDLIGEALADLDGPGQQTQVSSSPKPLARQAPPTVVSLNSRLELPMEPTPSEGSTGVAPQVVTPSPSDAVPAQVGQQPEPAEPAGFAAEMTAPWRATGAPQAAPAEQVDAPEPEEDAAQSGVSAALEEALRDLEELRSQLAESRVALSAAQAECAEHRELAEQAHAQLSELQREHGALREAMRTARHTFDKILSAGDLNHPTS